MVDASQWWRETSGRKEMDYSCLHVWVFTHITDRLNIFVNPVTVMSDLIVIYTVSNNQYKIEKSICESVDNIRRRRRNVCRGRLKNNGTHEYIVLQLVRSSWPKEDWYELDIVAAFPTSFADDYYSLPYRRIICSLHTCRALPRWRLKANSREAISVSVSISLFDSVPEAYRYVQMSYFFAWRLPIQ